MKVLVTGASGFTGSYVVPQLISAGMDVTCFVRKTSDLRVLPLGEVKLAYGDLNQIETFQRALVGMDILISIASLGFGHAPAIIQSAEQADIKRAVFFSTTSIFTTLDPESKSIRIQAEDAIRDSSLAYTILRPTMIYGSSRDRNIARFIAFIHRSPVFPVFGSGEYHLQPVYVKDLAQAVPGCIREKKTIGKVYNIAGGTVLTLNELVDIIAEKLTKKIIRVHLPPAPFISGLEVLEKLSVPFPLKSEQIRRFNEDKAFPFARAALDFGYQPTSFKVGLEAELAEMGLLRG